MTNFFAELKRRQMFRVAAAYAVVAWLLLQVFNNLTPMMRLPEWAGTLVLVFLVGGFPLTLLAAWARELAPADGAAARPGTTKLDYVLIGALVLVIALVSYQQLVPPSVGTVQQQASAPATGSATQTASISIAVLPFANVSGDATQEFFSDGMTDEIISALARVQNLRIVGRSSAFQFKGQNRDLRAIGQSLGATHLIDGSVRRVGNRVRITAQLVQAGDGVGVWTESYDRELTDVFAIQEDIAQSIAVSLRVPLGLRQGDALVNNRSIGPEAYQEYLRAKALVLRGRAEAAEAVKLLEPLVARFPDYAPAWALLSLAYRSEIVYNPIIKSGPVEEARRFAQSNYEKGAASARRAIQLDSKYAGGYAALAATQFATNDYSAREDSFKKALALDGNDPLALFGYSLTLANAGRLKEALRFAEQLRMLEPLVPAYNTALAEIMQYNGLNDASIPILEAIPADDPAYYRSLNLAQAYAAQGRFTAAADVLLATKGTDVSRRSIEDAARLLRQAPAKVSTPDALPVLEGRLDFVYAYIGALDRVMDNSERASGLFNTGETTNLWLPVYAPVRKTERFKTHLRTAGLVDYWRANGWPDLCRPVGADDFTCD